MRVQCMLLEVKVPMIALYVLYTGKKLIFKIPRHGGAFSREFPDQESAAKRMHIIPVVRPAIS